MQTSRLARVLACSLLASLAALPARAQSPSERTDWLPDTTVLLRVNDRPVRVADFVDSYFAAWPEYRPQPDSLGRIQFLNQFLNKEILANLALKANYTLAFEERQSLREHTQRVLSNVLFQRMVRDSIKITDADVKALRKQYSTEKHLQQITFRDQPTAERVWGDLVANKITWSEAHRRYCISKEKGPDGDLGWMRRDSLDTMLAPIFFDPLEPGRISRPGLSMWGYAVVREVAERPVPTPSWAVFDHILKREITYVRTAERTERVQRALREEVGLTFVDSNLVYVSARFPAAPPPDPTGAVHLTRYGTVPNFPPSDTSRVLARWRGGQLTLDGLLREYRETNSFMRTPLHTPEQLRAKVETVALEPYRAKLGIKLGYDKDPMAVSLIEGRRAQMLIDHLYQDSIMSKIRVTQAERRKYYDTHAGEFLTYASARYAVILGPSKARADSVAARLRAGEPALSVLRSDSLHFGRTVGGVRTMTGKDRLALFYKPLFEELKPGQVSVELDPERGYAALQLLAFDPGHQLPFSEAQKYVDESLQNIAAEKMLDALLTRHRKAMRIEIHPELVMRIRLEDPLDQS